jgi:hypothetical protein
VPELKLDFYFANFSKVKIWGCHILAPCPVLAPTVMSYESAIKTKTGEFFTELITMQL